MLMGMMVKFDSFKQVYEVFEVLYLVLPYYYGTHFQVRLCGIRARFSRFMTLDSSPSQHPPSVAPISLRQPVDPAAAAPSPPPQYLTHSPPFPFTPNSAMAMKTHDESAATSPSLSSGSRIRSAFPIPDPISRRTEALVKSDLTCFVP